MKIWKVTIIGKNNIHRWCHIRAKTLIHAMVTANELVSKYYPGENIWNIERV